VKRDIITIDDLSNEEIENLFALADTFLPAHPEDGESDGPARVRGRLDLADKFILASLFYEPSTRTRFSFNSAMHRLGGSVIESADPMTTSVAKGETIADTIRVIENYADVIVIRHPREGAARVAADYARIPVINAGDGGHEHPTQTLCDLYTFRREKKSLKNLNVLLCGDLKNGRTIHSLVFALARFGARIITRPAEGLELPPHVRRRLENDYGCITVPKEKIDSLAEIPDIDLVYVASKEHLPFESPADIVVNVQLRKKDLSQFDVCYVTRFQSERYSSGEKKSAYPVVDREFLSKSHYKKTRVLHPLPRVDELAYDIDDDPRGAYFQQASYGVPVRMALMATLLGVGKASLSQPKAAKESYSNSEGIACPNPRCVSNDDAEKRYLVPRFWVVPTTPPLLRCTYCEVEVKAGCVGSISTRRYYTDTSVLKSMKLPDVIVFASEQEAQKAGFEPARTPARKSLAAR